MTITGKLVRATAFALTSTVLAAATAPALAQETINRPGAHTYMPYEGGCWNELGNGLAKAPCGND
jgi:hypothetical protein